MKNLKTLSKLTFGFTILELVIVIALLSSIFVAVIINIDPVSRKKSARNSLRLSNINEIERVVNEYYMDTGKYPGEANTLYISNTINWIPITNIDKYITVLPKDPSDNFYFYIHNTNTYEINGTLENSPNLMQTDNGNDIQRYEVGTNLNLLKPN